jgi:poly(3-hydroxybutyrate) depolymerase
MMSREAYSAAMALAFAGALSAAHLAAPAPETAMALLAEAEPSFEKGQFSEEVRADLTPAAPGSSDYQPPDFASAKHQLDVGGVTRTWYGMSPSAGTEPRPAIVLLHGSQRDGRSMLDMWQATGSAEEIVLIAPDAYRPGAWSPRDDGPDFLAAVVAEASAVHAIDPDRIYLFGHSAGANFALYLAQKAPGPWRAAAAHAGAYDTGGGAASGNPIPVFIYVGNQDHIFRVDRTRAAARSLAASGHNVEFAVIPDHTHWYYEIGPSLARDAWEKLKAR